ncbi:1,4-beta-D-glucan cellobiohydrolase C [Aspergillus spectabilis]
MRSIAWSIAIALLPAAATAQQTLWGQCGGQGWTGPTSCVAGAACSTQNAFYAQCLPAATTTTTQSTTTTTTRTTLTTTTSGATVTTTSSTSTITATASGNPFSGHQLYVNPYYSSEVHTLAIPSLTGTLSSLSAAATAAAKVPSFAWFFGSDVSAKVPRMAEYLADIRAQNSAGANPPVAAQFVVYNLPDRDCAALASNGELSIANNGVQLYKNYIDSIRDILEDYSDVRTILVIEPDSLANLVTNLNVPKCANARSAYLECTDYAVRQLNLPNVAMYLDAGHAGWLGWAANLQPAANMYASVYKNAGSPASLRGLATNVANYNAWTISTCPSYTQGNTVCDEKRYVNALGPLLNAQGWDAHFITDTGRSGKQPTGQNAWGDWCNVIGTGFGQKPTTNTGDALVDAFVWVKPGGESDGTSDSSAVRYDAHCGYSDALQPAPEAGTWFQAYFVQLLKNANPAL